MTEEPRMIKIVFYEIKKLHNAEYNPRQITNKQFDDLKNSIKKFGFQEPVIVNVNKERKNIIISGHQRIKVAQELKMQSVPCVEVNLTKKQEQELNIRMNKNTGDWDFNILSNEFEIQELYDWGFLDLDLGLNSKDVDADIDEKDICNNIDTKHECPKCGYKW